MASIKSQMTLNDGMSAVLKKITSALDTTLHCFEQVQEVSGQAIDTELIKSAHLELAQANNQIRAMEDGYKKAAQEEEKLNKGIHEGTRAADGLLGKITAMVAAYASISSIKGLITDSLEAADVQIGAQVQLKTVMGNMGTLDYYDQVLDKAADIQRNGMYGDETMIAGAGELATYFSDGEALLSMMDTLTNYAAGMSGGGELDSAAMVDYATGIGKIMTGSYDAMTKKGFEFSDTQKAIIEGSATEAQIVAELGTEYLGLSQDMQAAAVIGSVIDENWAGLYQTMSKTPKGQIISFNNALGDIKETVGAGIYPAVLKFMNTISEHMPQIESLAQSFAETLGVIISFLDMMITGALDFATFVQDNWSIIGPIVMGIVAALTAYAAVSGAVTVANGIHAASEATKAAAQAMATGATFAETAAQYGLNAALYACPITWIIVLIIALIALFYAAVEAVNKFAGTSYSATGIICGAFMVALAYIGNLFVALWNLVVDVFVLIYNLVAEVANFIGNVFTDPIGSICRMFFDLADTVLGILQALASAIDAIFGSNLAASVQGWRDSLSGWVDETFGKGEEVMAKMSADDMKLGRFEYGEAWDSGYSFGEGIEDSIGDLFNFDAGTIDDYTNDAMTGFTMDDISSNVGDIATNTGSMADSLSVSEEELKYLRDIAERDAINRFTTADVKIDMTGMTNRIDSDMDLDGVIGKLTDGFSEALITAAEGVHA